MAQQNGPIPPSPQIWLPSADSFGFDAPNSSQLWYAWDKKQFSRLGKYRRVYIRHEALKEFPNGSLSALPLWVLVVKLSEWHLRVPIWRGPMSFIADLPNDPAVMMTIAECISRGYCSGDGPNASYGTPDA